MTPETLEAFYPLSKFCRELERKGYKILREPPPFLIDATEKRADGDILLFYYKDLSDLRVIAAVHYRAPTTDDSSYSSYYSYYSSVNIHWLKRITGEKNFYFAIVGVSERHPFPYQNVGGVVESFTARRPDSTQIENFMQYHQQVKDANRAIMEKMLQQQYEERKARGEEPNTLSQDRLLGPDAYRDNASAKGKKKKKSTLSDLLNLTAKK